MAKRCRAYLQPVLMASLLVVLTGCLFEREQIERFSGPTMGSTYTVQFVATADTPAAADLQLLVNEYLTEVDAAFSTYRDDSLLSQFNALPANSCMAMPDSVLHVTATALNLAALSEGAFEPTIKPLLQAWGFGPGDAGLKHPDEQALADARANVGFRHVRVDRAAGELCKAAAVQLDFNSVVAGFVVDQIAQRFEAQGVDRYLIEVTGELKAKGLKPKAQPWRIAIEAPHDNERVAQQVVELDGIGVSSSGDYRNYYQENGVRLSHTLDPRTAKPISHNLASVTVLHPSAEQADGLSTLLMVLGPDEGYSFAKQHALAALFVTRDANGFTARSTPVFERTYTAPAAQSEE
ncbi:FAD:protein FMN transferase [Atopomonas sediminilitoris]|uniref:FAD:protein FMN transferase n=1 Tax=Atopomonas sediminilitoris TaxID=2919919 RepID=UPI003520A367